MEPPNPMRKISMRNNTAIKECWWILVVIILSAYISCHAQDENGFFREHPVVPFAQALAGHLSAFDRPVIAGFPEDTTARILWKPLDGATVGVQTLAALGVGGIIAGSTISVARAIDLSSHTSREHFGKFAVYFFGASFGAALIPMSVYYSGKWMGGNGDLLSTFIGATVGTSIAVVLVALPGSRSGESILATTAVSGIAGAILGYHISSSRVYETAKDPLTIRLSHNISAQLLPRISQVFGQPSAQLAVVLVKL